MNIRDLNAISQLDAYSISLQFDVLQTVQDCIYIFVIDCFDFFYQWRIHFSDRHKLTVIIHREQKTFNVAVMRYRNSSFYVQRQINRVLRSYNFAKIYINDIIIYSKSLSEHFEHLRKIFEILKNNNISMNSKKTYIEYSSVNLLEQYVNFFDFAIDEQKLKAIAQLVFSVILKQFEIYLKFIEWFRNYIRNYATKFKSLQERKILLLKDSFKSDNARKSFFSRIKIIKLTKFEIKSVQSIQKTFFKSIFLIHFNAKRQLYVDLNFSKEEKIDAMMYHVFDDRIFFSKYSFKRNVQSVLFLNRLLTSVEIRYWSTKLKLTKFVWMLKKIRHFIEFFKLTTILYTNHDAALNIAKQIILSTSSTDKFNLRLIRISNYIQRFNLNIRHKSKKLHIIFDVLSRLLTISFASNSKSYITTFISVNTKYDEFDTLHADVHFIASLIEIDSAFKKRIIDEYVKNFDWQKIIKILNIVEKNQIKISFFRKNDLIFKKKIDDNTSFVLKRMCILSTVIKEILALTHDIDHVDFDRIYQRVVSEWYIRNLTKHLKTYFKHCSNCKVNQTRRHKFYESLQSILSSFVSFHTFTINFVLTLSNVYNDMNIIMSIICKFSKKITIIFDMNIWKTFQWAETLLQKLNIADWEFFKILISDRNIKFFFDFWASLFSQLNVKLLYFIAYHSQSDEVFERTNQTLKIVLRFFILTIDSKNWSSLVDSLQKKFNNSFISVERSSNEICYKFISFTTFNLVTTDASNNINSVLSRLQMKNNIAHEQMLAKLY